MTVLIKTNSGEFGAYLKDASHFTGFADRLIVPENKKDISEILREHHFQKTPVTVTGNHTGLTGASVARGGSVLATDRLNRILAVEQGFAIVEPGVSLHHLFQTLEPKRLLYPPDPGEWKAFLGGTVATNASGPRAFKYGTTRKWIRRLEVVLPTGEILDIPRGKYIANQDHVIRFEKWRVVLPGYFPPVPKSVTGYLGGAGTDLIDVMIGSEGTLGITTEIEIGLLPLPENVFTLIAFFGEEEDAWHFCSEARKASFASFQASEKDSLSARSIEYFDHHSLEFLRPEYPNIPQFAKAAIYLEQEFVSRKKELLVEWFDLIRKSKGFAADSWIASEQNDREEFREFRHALPELVNQWLFAHKQQKIGTDMAVPFSKFESLMIFQKEALQNSGIHYVVFGHIGDAHVHLNMLPRNDSERGMARRLYSNFVREVLRLGGTISAEHGIGKMKREYFSFMLGKDLVARMMAVKKEFDPNLILNRGNLFADDMFI